jgi:hypothetical protein
VGTTTCRSERFVPYVSALWEYEMCQLYHHKEYEETLEPQKIAAHAESASGSPETSKSKYKRTQTDMRIAFRYVAFAV